MSTGQAIGGVVGAAAGFVIGGPTGAVYGAQIGMMAGGYLDPPKGPTMEGPRLSDLSVQTSTYGAAIPRVYGTVPISGNVFWMENNALKEVVKKKKSGGKGGGSSTTTETYTYYATFAVGLCEGPIIGVQRIWAGNDLIYNAGSSVITDLSGDIVTDIETIMASNAASSAFTIYTGSEDQQPNSRMQAEMGAANCPAYRGLAYIVFKDFALAKYGNSMNGCPIKVEVVKDATFTTLTQHGTNISSPDGYGNYKNMPYADESGCYLWRVDESWQYSSTPMVYQYLIKNDGVSVLVRAAPVGLNGVDPSGYGTGYLGNGQCDRNLLAVPYSTGDGGISIINSEFGVRHFDNPVFGSNSSRYCVHSGVLYWVACVGLGGPNIQLNYCNLSSGAVQTLALPFSANGGLAFALGVVSDQLCVVYSNAADSITYAVFFDVSTLVYTSSYNVLSLNAGINTGSIEFDRGVMYFCDGTANVYKLTEHDGAPEIVGTFPDLTVPGAPQYSFRIFDRAGVITTWLSFYGTPGDCKFFTQNVIAPTAVPFSYIIEEECKRSGLLLPSDVEVSSLTDTVQGMRIGTVGSIRSVVEVLRGIKPFDMIQSGYKIKGVARGGASVATIGIGDLGVDEQLKQTREMDSQLPVEIVASYLDMSRDYDANQQAWERINTESVNKLKMDFPVSMTADQAAQAVEILGNMYWLERTDFGPFTLPPTHAALEPGDVITLDAGYAVYDIALRTVNYKSDGALECSGKLSSPATYVSTLTTSASPSDNTIGVTGASYYALLDIPVIDEVSQNSPGMVAAMCGITNKWSGGSLFSSSDSGQTWTDLQAFDGAGTFGYTGAKLSDHPGDVIQRGGYLVVSLLAGAVFGITESQMLSGQNFAAYGAHGRWEIIRFSTATLNANGTYTLGGFVRGDKGTEWSSGLHEDGDLFVLLDDVDNTFVSLPTEAIGSVRAYRGITSGASIDSDSDRELTYSGVNLECLSPAYPAGYRASYDLTMMWTRRSRISSSWWSTGVVAPVGETVEAYEIDIMDGADVKRTITSSIPSATYTSAEQIADFGSNQSAVTVKIYQLSSVVGRGYPLEATL